MLNPLKMIPLSRLRRSPANVRKTYPDAELEELAASILAHGLLENLVVSGPTSGTRRTADQYGVAAGGRRLAALQLLAKRKKIKPDHPVPCQVRGETSQALAELSLAENIERVPLHPADQYEAFAALSAEGQSADAIAARFGLAATLVVQRLKLAAVSPRLLAEYRQDRMSLEQLTAFTVSDDHTAQEALWFDTVGADLSPFTIRRRLTETLVEGRDRRALLIGVKAYEAAGGTVTHDLFREKSGGYFGDAQLLDRLVSDRIRQEQKAVEAEGWGWVEASLQPDYGWLARCGRIKSRKAKLSGSDVRRLGRLRKQYAKIVSDLEHGDVDASGEQNRLAAEVAKLEAKEVRWPQKEKAQAGAYLYLDSDGQLAVLRGLIWPREAKPADRSRAKREKAAGAYPDAVLIDLSAHRTAALRATLGGRPEDALKVLLARLGSALFFPHHEQGCVRIDANIIDLSRASDTVGESRAGATLQERHARWQEQMPTADGLSKWLDALSLDERLALLAHCVSLTLDGLWRRVGGNDRFEEASSIASHLSLDLAEWWRPTRANFFDRVSKHQILDAVSEAVSPLEAKRIAALKKPEMAARAESLIAKTRWLPSPLRAATESECKAAA